MTASETPADQPHPPGTPGNPLRLDNPQMMRALAHPARIAMLQHLVHEDVEMVALMGELQAALTS